jgi:hypothetical protein
MPDQLLATDISDETAREMQAAKLADAKRGLVWKVPFYAVGMVAFWVMHEIELRNPSEVFFMALTATGMFGRELHQFHRLCTIDPKQRLIEDELTPDDD